MPLWARLVRWEVLVGSKLRFVGDVAALRGGVDSAAAPVQSFDLPHAATGSSSVSDAVAAAEHWQEMLAAGLAGTFAIAMSMFDDFDGAIAGVDAELAGEVG